MPTRFAHSTLALVLHQSELFNCLKTHFLWITKWEQWINVKAKYLEPNSEIFWLSTIMHLSLKSAIMTAKTTTVRRLYDHAFLNSVMFPQLFWYFSHDARHFLPVKFFSPSIQKTMFRPTAKCDVDRWITRVIISSTGINGIRLIHHIGWNENGDLSFLLFFRNSAW